MPLYRLLQNTAVEPLHVEAMHFAFEAVCVELGLADRTDPLRDMVARKVIEHAQRGERDPVKLRDQVLAALTGIAMSDTPTPAPPVGTATQPMQQQQHHS